MGKKLSKSVGGTLGGVGTLVGGGIGGLLNPIVDPLAGKSYNVNGAAFAPGADEQQYIAQLQGLANGQAVSPAQLQMNQALQQSTAQSQALAASQRGVSPALAARLAAMGQAGTQQKIAGDTGILRAQEQQNAMGMLGNEMQSVRTGQMNAEALKAHSYENQAARRGQVMGGLLSGLGSAGAAFGGGGAKGSGGGAGAMSGESGGLGAAFAHGGMVDGYNCGGMTPQYSEGGKVPGKPVVGGDNPKNDVVPAMLSPGEIVIPRSILDHEHGPEMAKAFVEGILASKKKDKFDEGGMAQKMGQSIGRGIYNSVQPVGQALGTLGQGVSSFFGGIGQGIDSQVPPDQAPFSPPVSPELPHGPMSAGEPAQVPPTAAQLQAQQDPYGYGAYQNEAMKGLNLKAAGIQGEAKAMGDLGKAQYEAAKPYLEKNVDITNQMQQLQWNMDQDSQKYAQDAANQKIDPEHYLNSMSTGHKVQSAISLVLGGVGGGMTGKGNSALDFINSQIDRDIRGQEMNMAQKNNLFKMNMDLFGHRMDALAKTKADVLAVAEQNIKMQALQSQDPLAQARAQQLLGGLSQERANLYQQIATRKMMADAFSNQGGSPEKAVQAMELVDPERAKDMRKRLVPGVGIASVEVPTEARNQITATNTFLKQIEDLDKFAKAHEGSWDPATINYGKAKAAAATNTFREAEGLGVFKESGQKFEQSIIPSDPTQYLASLRTSPKFKAMLEYAKQKRAGLHKEYGLQAPLDYSALEGKYGK